MIRIFLTVSTALTLAFAAAADPATVIASAAPFEGAIDGISDITTISHLPGYGLHVNAWWLGDYDLDNVVTQLRGIVTGLSGLVRGLDAGDWVSVAWTGQTFMGDPVHLVVRMLPGDASSLETWVNGALQN